MDSPRRPQRWELWSLVALLLLAAALRLVALVDVPPGLRYDELLNYRMAGRVLAGDRPLYFAESWGHEPLFHYAQAGVIAVTRACDWSLRLPAAVCGVLSVLTTWLAARRLCGPRVAILAAAGLTVSFWSIFYSREGSRVIAIAPLTSLMVAFLWRGVERSPARRRHAAVDLLLAGVCWGVQVYVYVAGRTPPVLLAAFALYLALCHWPRFKRVWAGLLLALAVGALIGMPLFLLLRQNPGMEQRLDHLASAWTALEAGDPRPVLSLSPRAVGMFIWRGEEDWLFNVYGRPVFDPLTAACFVLGAALCVGCWRRARCALLLLWLGAGVGPIMVAPPAASLSHAIAAQPAAYVLLALGLDGVWRAAQKLRRGLGPLLAVGVLLLHGALSGIAYFHTWAGAPEVRELYQGGITAVARELEAHDPPGPVAIGAPYVNYWHHWNAVAFDLTVRRKDLDVRWFNPAGGWVWPGGPGPATTFFPVDPLGPQSFDPELEELFLADATPLPPADDFAAFRVVRPAALEEWLDGLAGSPVTWPPDLAHLPPPALPLTFGGRFALLGVERQEQSAPPGGELRLVTAWEVLEADPSPVVAFVHLVSDGETIWGQSDWLDVWADGLQPGDRFAQVHRVLVSPETPPGLTHAQLGLYRPDTLLRLPIDAGAEHDADRVWIAEVEVIVTSP